MVARRKRPRPGFAVAILRPPLRSGTCDKFCKGTLGRTTPRVRHPEQADRWMWLILVAYAQLRLARDILVDLRLPWERSLPPMKPAPRRVLRSIATLLPLIGRRQVHRNLAEDRQDGPKGGSLVQRSATRPSRRLPEADTNKGFVGRRRIGNVLLLRTLKMQAED